MYTSKELRKVLGFYGSQITDYAEELKAALKGDTQELKLVERALHQHIKQLKRKKQDTQVFDLKNSIACGKQSVSMLKQDIEATKEDIDNLTSVVADLTQFIPLYRQGKIVEYGDIYETVDKYLYKLGHRKIMKEIMS